MEKKNFLRATALVCVAAAALSLSACGISKTASNQKIVQNQAEEEYSASSTFSSDSLDFSGKDFDGKTVSAKDIFSKNKVTLVNVWSVTCPYCIDEMPDLAKLHTKLKDQNAGVLSVYAMSGYYSGDEEQKEAKDILSESKADFPVIIADDDFYNQVNVSAFPLSFLVDQNGKIISDPIYGAESMEEYQKTIQDHLK